MKTKLAVLFGTVCLGALAAPALAGDHTQPGTPGDANCVGQTDAYLAQLGKTVGLPDARGLGQLGAYVGYTVPELQAIAQAYCNS
ncbi:MAG: hypothetical protein ACYDA3_12000 [Gaiellaceae bacterium]